ncbi:hypothetical protein ELQ92_15910 [Labedella populi]|uniref:Uncharacterized protein n=1 Tax=Labedella populi TaxID=2498850 RepID=A0A3S3ZWC7_9MICO|nr:hypothetical protein [Labedella populi]RWZ55105.1 hypothetical protein ELQ92_15910 [Labedella populi]
MTARVVTIGSIAATAAVSVLLLAGCSAGPGTDGTREAVHLGVRAIPVTTSDDMDDFALAASRVNRGGTLIDVDVVEGAKRGDVIGTLYYQVGVPRAEFMGAATGEQLYACYSVEFDFWGPRGDFNHYSYLHEYPCPTEGAIPAIDLETDYGKETRILPAPNAADAAIEVLQQLPTEPGDPALIGGAIAALFDASGSTSWLPVENAPPRVVVNGGDVGVAMGDENECVLVARVGGVTEQKSIAPVKLRPGELGCAPESALASDEARSSPH